MTRTLTAAGLTFQIHTRQDWQTATQPVTGPAPYPDKVHTCVVHWPGNADSWVPDKDVAAHLRRGQASYLANKGYSYGYNFVIGPNPILAGAQPVFDVWEVRGIDVRNAANNGDFPPYSTYSNPNWNGYTTSIQFMSSVAHPPTVDQQLAFRYMLAWLDGFYGEVLALQGHRVSDQTSCPGDAIMKMISSLAIRPTAVKPPPPVPPPPKPVTSYTVVAGDSWYAIARKVGCTPAQLVAANPPATMATVLHPGDVLKVPSIVPTPPPSNWFPNEPQTADAWRSWGAAAATPPPTLRLGDVNPNVTWWQAVFSSMGKLPADGGAPIYDPNLIAYDRIGSGPPTRNLYGDASKAACVYWQSKNALTADGVYGPQTQAKVATTREQ